MPTCVSLCPCIVSATTPSSCSGGSSGVTDSNGQLGAGIIVLIVFLVLLLIVLPAALAIAYFACGCALCGRSRAKTEGAVLAATTPSVVAV